MRYKIISIFVLIIITWVSSFAQEQGRELKEPLTVNGDKVEYIPEKNVMVAEGNVEVVYEGMFLYADKVTVWMDKNEALAEGNVRLVRDGATFYGDKVSYYFKENKGKIISPRFEKYGPWYGKGLEAEEYEKGKYLLKKAYITTCDLEKPHYRFQAKLVKVIPGEKIIARNVVFYIKDTPVFY
ncbi:MAG TPA: LPS-assembly protein LptD, partial [Candidatus Omnitrophica bacterium]|nr:LPS-assembly protein LptD [Candidatus Omnitrophota bacterium]